MSKGMKTALIVGAVAVGGYMLLSATRKPKQVYGPSLLTGPYSPEKGAAHITQTVFKSIGGVVEAMPAHWVA